MRFISKIDLKYDKFVKSVQMEGLRNLGDPIKTAENYYLQGVDELIICDCSASWFDQEINYNYIKEITKNIYIPTFIGGGIKDLYSCEKFFNNGADKIIVNTGAINKPEIIDKIAKKYGSQSLTISIDYKYFENKFQLYKCFGRDRVILDIEEWIDEVISRGAGEIFFCSIDQDGTGKSFDENILYLLKKKKISVPIIISGGFGKIEDLNKLINYKDLIQGVCISKALHYNQIKIPSIKSAINKLSI